MHTVVDVCVATCKECTLNDGNEILLGYPRGAKCCIKRPFPGVSWLWERSERWGSLSPSSLRTSRLFLLYHFLLIYGVLVITHLLRGQKEWERGIKTNDGKNSTENKSTRLFPLGAVRGPSAETCRENILGLFSRFSAL